MEAGRSSNAGSSTGSNAGPSSGSSSDFVRKLYKMLEDPSYSETVRWGDDGTSFVVLECEKFTKNILPKHFKHSNFASFVRQLNKYDFHKVRQNNEESGQSPYGPNAWEFRHPDFRANNKESLDNIRRKAPAPRKNQQSSEDPVQSQQLDMMNSQLLAQQQQIQQLTERQAQLTVEYQLAMQEVAKAQKTIVMHESVIQQLLNYLLMLDARQRRDNRAGTSLHTPGQDGSVVTPSQADDGPASPLQQAAKILNDLSAQMQINFANLEQLNDPSKAQVSPTPPLGNGVRNGTTRAPNAAGTSAASTLGYPKMNGELESVVYPVGTTNGIDPMYSEQVNNIPYSVPPKEADPTDPRRQQPQQEPRKKNVTVNPGWLQKPNILLVEDDATCRQIGGKFLYSFNCEVDSALDGLEAINKVQGGKRYDLILMDIIMPNLDGVSACQLIRQFDRTPIIAMTSNIRSDDIQLYFQNGMDDVLPKPFTRKSLLEMLEKHLVHLKSIPQPLDASATAPLTTQNSTTQNSIKEESPTGQSPAASMTNWQSPGQIQTMSPMNLNMQQMTGQYMTPMTPAGTAFAVDQNGVQYPAASAAPLNPGDVTTTSHRRQISELSSTPDVGNFAKRQRLYQAPTMVPQLPAQQNG